MIPVRFGVREADLIAVQEALKSYLPGIELGEHDTESDILTCLVPQDTFDVVVRNWLDGENTQLPDRLATYVTFVELDPDLDRQYEHAADDPGMSDVSEE